MRPLGVVRTVQVLVEATQTVADDATRRKCRKRYYGDWFERSGGPQGASRRISRGCISPETWHRPKADDSALALRPRGPMATPRLHTEHGERLKDLGLPLLPHRGRQGGAGLCPQAPPLSTKHCR